MSLQTLDDALMPISDLQHARTIVLLGADPSEREPVMELRIRQAINKHGARLVVVHPDEIALTSKASATFDYAPERFADMCHQLARGLQSPPSTGAGSGGSSAERRWMTFSSAFTDPSPRDPFAVVYDDTFAGVDRQGRCSECRRRGGRSAQDYRIRWDLASA